MPIGRHIAKLSGYAPALPTPFDLDGGVDIAAFENLCGLQIARGATALVVGGTTGEAPTLSPAEHVMLIQIAVGVARSQVPVIAGAGSNSTSHAIELTREAEAAGVLGAHRRGGNVLLHFGQRGVVEDGREGHARVIDSRPVRAVKVGI